VAGNGDGRIRFEEGGKILAKFANTYFDCGHEMNSSAIAYTHVYA